MLEQILQNQFGSPGSPRGIIFTRTRQSAHSLLLWLQQQPGLQAVDIRAELLIGAGNSSQSTHMTQVWALGEGAEAGEFPRGEEKGSLQHREMGAAGGAEEGDGHRSPGLKVFPFCGSWGQRGRNKGVCRGRGE